TRIRQPKQQVTDELGRFWLAVTCLQRMASYARSFLSCAVTQIPRARFIIGDLRLEPQRVELAVECRAADPQPTGDFGHVSLIMRDGEANGFSLDVLQRTHGALGVEQRQRTKG